MTRAAAIAVAGVLLAGCGMTTKTVTQTVTTTQTRTVTVVRSVSTGTPAGAPSTGRVSLTHLPQSDELQATATVTHSCGAEPSCFWFIELAQYSGKMPCPPTFDESHTAGTGGQQNAPGTATARIAFAPANSSTSTEVCVYVHDASSNTDDLVRRP